jgi:hypothetical protein
VITREVVAMARTTALINWAQSDGEEEESSWVGPSALCV